MKKFSISLIYPSSTRYDVKNVMKQLFLSLGFLSLLWQSAFAQEKRTMTLEQCIEYAYQNTALMQKSVLDEQIAEARVKETIGIGLPQINGSAQLLYNFELRPAFLPAFFLSQGSGSPPDPDAEFVPVRGIFAPRYQGDAGITVSQLIFNGSYFVGLQASKTYKELTKKTTASNKVTIAENVTKAYFSLLVAKERAKLIDANIARLDSLIKDVKALNKQGFAENIEVTRLEVTANNLRAEKMKVERLIELSQELLKFQMGMPVQEKIEVTGSLRDYQLEQIPDGEVRADYKNRAEYQVLETAIALTKLDLKNKQVGAYPSLVAIGQMGYATGARYFSNIGDFSNRWLGYGTVGLQLNLPIFNGMQRKYKVEQNRIEILKLEQDKRNLEKAIDFQTTQAQITLKNALTTLEAQKRNMELAKEVLRVSEIKYKQGVGSSVEIINAETAYKEAETNYFAALYDALIAKVDLDKALGKLGK
jgi:outer membrane protein TolC